MRQALTPKFDVDQQVQHFSPYVAPFMSKQTCTLKKIQNWTCIDQVRAHQSSYIVFEIHFLSQNTFEF